MEITHDNAIKYKGKVIEAKHVQNVMNKLIDSYEYGKFCDVTLVAVESDRKIPAHRLILMASSPHFDAMFSNSLEEKDKEVVVLTEINGDELKSLIDFCYTGYIDINQDNVYEMFKIASRLKFREIEERCRHFFRSNLNPSNCFKIWSFCQSRPNLEEIVEPAVKSIQLSFPEVVATCEYLLLNSDQLFTLLSSDDLDVWCEEEVFNALVKWVNHDEEGRKDTVRKLMSAIRFTQLRPKFLYWHVKEFCRKFDCYDLFEKSSLQKMFPDDAINPCLPRKSCTMKWLIAVGNDGFQNPEYRNSEIYSPMTNKWRLFKELRWDQDGSTFILASDDLYILGGLDKNKKGLNSVIKYNFTTKEFMNIAQMKKSRAYFDAAVLNNNIFVAGGIDSNSVERYDLEAEKWIEMPPMLEKRQNHKLVVLNSRLFAIGGRTNANKALGSVESYDFFQNKWQSQASMNYVRSGHAALVHNDEIIVIGGQIQRRSEQYSPLIDKWVHLKPLGLGAILYGFGLAVSDENFYINGGSNDNNAVFSKTYKINLDTLENVEVASLTYKRKFCGLLQVPSYNPN